MADLTEQQLLSTDPEVLGLQRQRQLANLLTGQAFNQPQGQMISGHYVKPSALQSALPMINAAIGGLTNANLDTKQTELAAALRGQKAEAYTKFQELMSNPATRGEAMKYAAGNQYLQPLAQELMKGMKLAEGEKFVMPNLGGGAPVELATGGAKYRAPLQIDTGKNIEIRDPNDPTKVLQVLPKTHVFAPHASQLVPVQGGFAEYNPNTKTFLPIGGGQGGAAGTPTGALMPPLPAHIQKEITETNQQTSIINDAIKGVEGNRQYFGPKYAAPEILGGDFGQSRMNAKLPEGAVEARSNVFNTASAVIKERAGTAQTPSEKTIIMRFLPSIYDGDATVIRKLNAYNKYIESKATGTTAVPGAIPTYQGQAKSLQNAGPPTGVTEAEWNAMPPADRKLFQ
jgi:hypothetical protein